MSLESILNHIIKKAEAEKDTILQNARRQAEEIIKEASQEADRLYQNILNLARQDGARQRQGALVNYRLQQQKNLLSAKQQLITEVFVRLKSQLHSDKFKKQQVYVDKTEEAPEDVDFYLAKIRQDYETEIAKILFG